MSYRYATYRTENLTEPIQLEAFGSCEGSPSAAAVANYVANNNAGLTRAVTAHHAGDTAANWSSAASLVGEVEAKSVRISTVAVPSVAMTSLVAAGVLLVRAARAARERVQLY